jgi:beta-glucosidase
MVLLKNEGDLLPLSTGLQRLAVVGPLADDPRTPLGTWAALGRPEDVDTVLAGIQAHTFPVRSKQRAGQTL